MAPPADLVSRPLTRCRVCRVSELYRVKDFNPRLGVAIVVAAAVLAYWTWGLSLVAAVLIDWWLYRRVPEVVVCYWCQAHYRRLPQIKAYAPFDLAKHDAYRTLRDRGERPPLTEL